MYEGGQNTMNLSFIFHLGKIESNSSEITRITLEQGIACRREMDQNKLFFCNCFQIIPLWTFCSGEEKKKKRNFANNILFFFYYLLSGVKC